RCAGALHDDLPGFAMYAYRAKTEAAEQAQIEALILLQPVDVHGIAAAVLTHAQTARKFPVAQRAYGGFVPLPVGIIDDEVLRGAGRQQGGAEQRDDACEETPCALLVQGKLPFRWRYRRSDA